MARQSKVTQPSEPQGQAPEFVTASDYKRIYANNVNLSISPVDVRLTFNELISDEPQKPVVERRVTVVLSVQTTKALAQLLMDNVRGYEQQFGEIRYTAVQPQTEESSQPQQPTKPPFALKGRRLIEFDEDDKKA